jgi:uncharacterized membrane protein
MAFCGKCGSGVTDGVAFCPQCGAPVGASAAAGAPIGAPPQYVAAPVMASSGTSGLQENVAGLLCYVLGWLTGLIFLLIDKRPFVRFHAAQSIVVFGSLFILRLVLTFGIIGSGFYGFFSLWSLLSMLLSLVTLVAWVVLMVMAYQGKHFEVPIAAGIAKSIAGSNKV